MVAKGTARLMLEGEVGANNATKAVTRNALRGDRNYQKPQTCGAGFTLVLVRRVVLKQGANLDFDAYADMHTDADISEPRSRHSARFDSRSRGGRLGYRLGRPGDD